ncbi:MAG TPA: hypothetical protein VFT55_17805, partial [Planctomycetota bacterium]|nr:hypothetical protein [Planctomycetota bacterium]
MNDLAMGLSARTAVDLLGSSREMTGIRPPRSGLAAPPAALAAQAPACFSGSSLALFPRASWRIRKVMGLRVHADVVSIQAQQHSQRVERPAASCRRLWAGLRISTSADAERQRAQIRSIENVQHDADDGACLVRTAEDALDEVSPFVSSLRGLVARPKTVRARDPDRRGRLAESNRVMDIDAAIHT